MPCFTVATCGKTKCLSKVSATSVDTLISHCKAKNEDMGLIKGWDGANLVLRFVSE